MTKNFGNPSSLHYVGVQAYQALNVARNQIAKMWGAKTNCIVFTSGGTESNNLAIQGGAAANLSTGKHVVTTAIEHSSVLGACGVLEKQGYQVTYVRPDPVTGCIRAEDFVNAVNQETALVSCMEVNSETGELLPIKEIIQGVRRKNPNTRIHVDCVQGFGKIPFKVYEYDADFLSASSHKIHGPKGIGALYIKDGVMVRPFLYGGKQERGIKPGTENVPLLVPLGMPLTSCFRAFERISSMFRVYRTILIHKLQEIPQVRLTMTNNISPYILNFSIPGIPSQETVSHFSMENIYIDAGSACSKGEPSHVIAAMGLPEEVVSSVIRVSFCRYNTTEEIDQFIATLKQWVETNRSRCIFA